MRKFKFWTVLLVVVGIAAACDKVEEVNPISGAENGIEEVITPDMEEMAKFVGLWTREASYEHDGQIYRTKKWELRFYKDGTGHMRIDYYNDLGSITGFSSGGLKYEIKDGLLCLTRTNKEPSEVKYLFEGDKLFITEYIEGKEYIYEFTKTEDADDRFVADWSTTYINNEGKYEVYHYKFLTPTYGYTYKIIYDDPNEAPDRPTWHYEFRYEFDDKKVYITPIGAEAAGDHAKIVKYYRIDGTKLYLRTKNDGAETVYSNFKAENGIK